MNFKLFLTFLFVLNCPFNLMASDDLIKDVQIRETQGEACASSKGKAIGKGQDYCKKKSMALDFSKTDFGDCTKVTKSKKEYSGSWEYEAICKEAPPEKKAK